MERIFTLLLVTLLIGPLKAQKNYKEGKSLTIQMEAFDFMAKGFSIWTAYTQNYNRFFLDGGRNELPDFLNPQSDSFYEKRQFFIQAGYCRFLKKVDGLYWGVEGIYQNMTILAKKSNESNKNPVLRVAPLIGFEWTPFIQTLPNLTLSPWMSGRIPIYSKPVIFTSTPMTYKTTDFNFVMGLNIGYRFSKIRE